MTAHVPAEKPDVDGPEVPHDLDARIADEVRRQLVVREGAILEAIVRRSRRMYPFALCLMSVGALCGGSGSAVVIFKYSATGVVMDGAGQAWTTTGIAQQPIMAASYIAGWAMLFAVIGYLVGRLIDAGRYRRRSRRARGE
jgi:hypothetical protein